MRKRERKCIPGIVDPNDLCWNEIEKLDNQLEHHRKELQSKDFHVGNDGAWFIL